ncbi:peptidoglycan-binding protein [Microvirga brassicacearum]|uniref:Serine protease n=1 Tax=Microvirga brassicacearum TaxID=2580413 RepID=A0A5N3P8E3_9HYPH|nr:peptidoglycan-binding protein [Microvirga brassicacearum]KAB0266009.1 serine protease [Microvirga brassicacearum]
MSRIVAWKQSVVGAVIATVLAVPTFQGASAQEPLGRAALASTNLVAARAAFEALPEADRKAMQEALIWAGTTYSGAADGVFGRQTFDAVAAFQQSKRTPPSGILSPTERADLQASAQRARSAVGFTIVDDPKTGARIGVPAGLLPKTDINPSGGSRWQSTDGRVTLDTRRAPPNATLASLYDRNLALQIPGRIITYKVLRPDFSVVAGETATGKFYTRYDAAGSDLRGFSIGYDKALAPQFDRLVVAIANSFQAFGATAPVASAVAIPVPPSAQAVTSPPSGRRLIGTGIAVTPRRVITTATLDSCRELRVGEVAVGGSQQPQARGWLTIELPRDLSAATASFGAADATPDQSIIVVGYTMETGRPTLSVMPGTMSEGQSFTAPLQPGASGAPVLDGSNRLVGIVGPVSDDGRKVAGITTTRRYSVVPSRDLAAAIPGLGDGTKAENARSAAHIAAFWASALVPLTCAP